MHWTSFTCYVNFNKLAKGALTNLFLLTLSCCGTDRALELYNMAKNGVCVCATGTIIKSRIEGTTNR